MIRVDFDVRDKLLIRYSVLTRLKKMWEYNGRVRKLFIDSEKAYDSAMRDAVYNILIEFLMPMIKMCLSESYSKIRMVKKLSDACPIQNVLKSDDAISPLLLNCPSKYAS